MSANDLIVDFICERLMARYRFKQNGIDKARVHKSDVEGAYAAIQVINAVLVA